MGNFGCIKCKWVTVVFYFADSPGRNPVFIRSNFPNVPICVWGPLSICSKPCGTLNQPSVDELKTLPDWPMRSCAPPNTFKYLPTKIRKNLEETKFSKINFCQTENKKIELIYNR